MPWQYSAARFLFVVLPKAFVVSNSFSHHHSQPLLLPLAVLYTLAVRIQPVLESVAGCQIGSVFVLSMRYLTSRLAARPSLE